MNDFILFLFIGVVFYYIIKSSDSEYLQCGFSYFRNNISNQAIRDNQLASFDKWQTNKNATIIPKIPHTLLEGFRNEDKAVIDSTKSLLLNIDYGDKGTDNYGDEPITDRLNTNVVGARVIKHTDEELLRLNLLRTNHLPEEENAYKQELKRMEEAEYIMDGNDLNNRISNKLKKNNQLAKKNNNAKILLSAVRDDMELDFAEEEHYIPWWEENIEDKFGAGFNMDELISGWK